MPDPGEQMEFDFSAGPAADSEHDGLARWRAEMRAEEEAEARRLGLPLRREVEVELESGAMVRGKLEFAQPELLRLARRPARLALRVGSSVFDHSQIARCIALD